MDDSSDLGEEVEIIEIDENDQEMQIEQSSSSADHHQIGDHGNNQQNYVLVNYKDKSNVESSEDNRTSELTKYETSAPCRSSLGPDNLFHPSANDALSAELEPDYSGLDEKDVKMLKEE